MAQCSAPHRVETVRENTVTMSTHMRDKRTHARMHTVQCPAACSGRPPGNISAPLQDLLITRKTATLQECSPSGPFLLRALRLPMSCSASCLPLPFCSPALVPPPFLSDHCRVERTYDCCIGTCVSHSSLGASHCHCTPLVPCHRMPGGQAGRHAGMRVGRRAGRQA